MGSLGILGIEKRDSEEGEPDPEALAPKTPRDPELSLSSESNEAFVAYGRGVKIAFGSSGAANLASRVSSSPPIAIPGTSSSEGESFEEGFTLRDGNRPSPRPKSLF